nr:putative F-box protein At4g38870 [Ipomoea trifida]
MSASKKTADFLTLRQEILMEILSKLPTKTLIRFRCVSKFFCALIVDHGFGVVHRSLSLTLPSRAGFLISIEVRTPPLTPLRRSYYTLNFSPHREGMVQANRVGFLDADPFLLSSSSDGLICVSKPKGDVAVCNVTTRQRISLPRMQYKECAPNLGSWREINNCGSYTFQPMDGYPSFYDSNTCVYIDGVIYSYNSLNKHSLSLFHRFHIETFEVGCESLSVITLPNEVPSQIYLDIKNPALLEVGGRLVMVLVHVQYSIFSTRRRRMLHGCLDLGEMLGEDYYHHSIRMEENNLQR